MNKQQAISHLKQIVKEVEMLVKTAEQLHNYIVEIESVEQAKKLLDKYK